MKKSILVLMTAIFAVATLQADAADKPPFKFSIEGMVLNRSNPGGNEIVTHESTGAELFNTDEFQYGWEFNLRAAFQVDITENATVEAVYFGLGEWSDDAALSSSSYDLSVLLDGANSGPSNAFDDANAFGMETESELYSIELNYLHTVHPSVRLLAGLRLVSINERASLTAQDTDLPSKANYNVETENMLAGGQIGVVVDHDLGHDIFIRGGAKLAGFWAHRQQDTYSQEDNYVIFRDEKSEDDGFAWLFEGEVLLGFRVTRHINVYGGYRVIYVSDVASATDHFVTPVEPTSGAASLELSDILYHGPTLGAEVTF